MYCTSEAKVEINVYQHFAVISVHEGRQNVADRDRPTYTPHVAHSPTAPLDNGHVGVSHRGIRRQQPHSVRPLRLTTECFLGLLWARGATSPQNMYRSPTGLMHFASGHNALFFVLRQISSNGRRPLPPECHGLVDQIS